MLLTVSPPACHPVSRLLVGVDQAGGVNGRGTGTNIRFSTREPAGVGIAASREKKEPNHQEERMFALRHA